MIFVGAILILMGAQTISVFNNFSNGLVLIGLGALLIYGRFKLEK